MNNLVKIDENVWNVVLASGGPLMKIICIEGENALCEWDGGRAIFPTACLRRLIRI